MALHRDLANAELHEPKGVSAAADGQAAFATSTAVVWEYETIHLNMELDDISTASSTFIPVPRALTVDKIYTVLHGALGTADAALTFKINGTNITSGGITVTQSGSAAGDVDTTSPSALNAANAGDYIELATDGASTNTIRISAVLICKRTG